METRPLDHRTDPVNPVHPVKRRSSCRGFTMVEMLVVVLVLGLLGLGFLLPVLCRARESCSHPRCGNSVGNLIKCCHLYSDAGPNLGRFPLLSERHNAGGQLALAKLYDAYVRDHRVYSCPSKPTRTAVLTRYLAPDESTLSAGYTNYGYDPGHTPWDSAAGILGDRGTLCSTNHRNSTNHGSDGPGQNVALGSGSVEWCDEADNRATRDANGCTAMDDIFEDDIAPPYFNESLETNIIP